VRKREKERNEHISKAVASLRMLLKRTVRDILLILLRTLPRPAPSHLPRVPVNPAWYHVSFLDDGNFLSTARLTYFLPDNGLKFHAVVVTIHSKKLIELDPPEGAPK